MKKASNKKKIIFKYPKYNCYNCDKIVPRNRQIKLFCSELCSEEAGTVRYIRRCKKDGRINREDVQESIKIRLAFIVSGGYPQKKRSISVKLRKKVNERFNGMCNICGKSANEVDHIKGSSNDIRNLQLLCNKCHRNKTMKNIVKVKPGDERYFEILEKRMDIDLRVDAKKPFRKSDDEIGWSKVYRKLENENKVLFYNSVSKIIMKYKNKDYSLRHMARILNDNKIPTYGGCKWDGNAVKTLFNWCD